MLTGGYTLVLPLSEGVNCRHVTCDLMLVPSKHAVRLFLPVVFLSCFPAPACIRMLVEGFTYLSEFPSISCLVFTVSVELVQKMSRGPNTPHVHCKTDNPSTVNHAFEYVTRTNTTLIHTAQCFDTCCFEMERVTPACVRVTSWQRKRKNISLLRMMNPTPNSGNTVSSTGARRVSSDSFLRWLPAALTIRYEVCGTKTRRDE